MAGAKDIMRIRSAHPAVSIQDCTRVLQSCAGDVEAAIQQLASTAIEKIQGELKVSREEALNLFKKFGWDIDAARRDLIDPKEIVTRLENARQKEIAAWLAKPPRDRAIKLLKNVRHGYQLADAGLLKDSGGLLGEPEPERWYELSDADRTLDSLYTALLLVECDQAQYFWELPAEDRAIIIADIAGAGWTEISSALSKAINETDDSIEAESRFDEMYAKRDASDLVRDLVVWIIANAERLSFFHDGANAPY